MAALGHGCAVRNATAATVRWMLCLVPFLEEGSPLRSPSTINHLMNRKDERGPGLLFVLALRP